MGSVRLPFLDRALEFQATPIGRDGRWLTSALPRQGIDRGDAEAALRQHGLERVGQMKLATLEEDGSISIVPADDGSSGGSHRRLRRYRRSHL